MIIAVAEGLIKALPKLIEKAPIIINKLVDAIVRNFPKIIKTGGELIGQLAMGIIGNIAKLIQTAPKLISALVNALRQGFNQIMNVGRYLIEGLWEGIQNAKQWVIDRVSELARSILDGMKSALGIHSPSKVFKEQIGKNIALGIGEGFTDEMKAVYTQMENTIKDETNTLGKEMTASGNVSIERNASVTSLLNGLIDQENTYTSNTILDGKVLATTINKINTRNKFAQGTA